MNTSLSLRSEVFGEAGYSTALRFTPAELSRIRDLITNQWLGHINELSPDHVDEFKQLGLSGYHELSHVLDHGKAWAKIHRILPQSAIKEIRTFSVFQALEREFGAFELSDEEQVGYEEIYWRLVRPGFKEDTGPLHADIWFHRICGIQWPPGTETVKVWAAICVEPGLSGLKIVPGSHRKEWKYTSEERHGTFKPQILEDERTLDVRVFNSVPGDCIVFHENLLHGGIPHQGKETRVSIEFTMLVKKP